jgi:exodeoxyribonuclease-1
MPDPQTFYWHDYETFGTDPQRDRPVQFAGVRTDSNFNILGDPLVVYCKPAIDCLPDPEACLITGITPQLAELKGVCEAEFIRLIHEQLVQPETCAVGYNSLRFDDEVTRNCLYRNFYDPYAREWQRGNSRWDLIDVVRAARALRPEGIHWPVNEEGMPTFRLDQLTIANGITHKAAHDALADVYATIAIAKLIKQVQPKLYRFFLHHRLKSEVLNLLQLGSFKPVIHVSSKYPAAKNCLAIVLPLCKHPTNANGIIVYDLSVNPEPLLSLSAEQIQQRLFTVINNLPDGMERIPLKTVHINKCPILAPLSVIREGDVQRLKIDLELCQANLNKIKAATGLTETLAAVFAAKPNIEHNQDPDLAIYTGGFFSEADKQKMEQVKAAVPIEINSKKFRFTDPRLSEMLFRYRARNYYETLSAEETLKWKEFCRNRLTGYQPGARITFSIYFSRLQELRRKKEINENTLNALVAYGIEKLHFLGIEITEESMTEAIVQEVNS